MHFDELFLLSLALAMDAFAAALCKGLSSPRASGRQMAVTGLWFGGFQALMPFLGYCFGLRFEAHIAAYDHWAACGLLTLIGSAMLRDAFGGEPEPLDERFTARALLPLAVATSIDALAAGVSLALLRAPLLPALCLIGSVTFLLSALGVRLGSGLRTRYHRAAQFFGGGILILLGLRLLCEHMGWLL